MLPRSLSREAQEGLHDRAGEPFVTLHRRAEPRQCATIQRFAFFKEMTYLTARASLGSSASASPSRSMRSSMELRSKLLISFGRVMGADNGAVDRSVEDEAGYGGGFLRPALHVVHALCRDVLHLSGAGQLSRRFRPPRYRAALIHLSASSRLSDRRPITCRGSFPLR